MDIIIDDSSVRTLDISTIQNDFIYKLIDFYLEEITITPSTDISQSITNLVDTIMSYYLLARQNGVINISNARKMLSLKLGKNPPNDNILNQCQKLSGEFEQLEKYIMDSIDNKEKMINDKIKEIPKSLVVEQKFEDLLDSHKDFISNIQKKKTELDSQIVVPEINTYKNAYENAYENKKNKNIQEQNIGPNKKISNLKTKLRKNIQNMQSALSSNQVRGKIFDKKSKMEQDENINHYTEPEKPTKLNEAMEQLYSRLNTPVINLFVVIIIFKAMTKLFGF